MVNMQYVRHRQRLAEIETRHSRDRETLRIGKRTSTLIGSDLERLQLRQLLGELHYNRRLN